MKSRFSATTFGLLVCGALLLPTAAIADRNELNKGSNSDKPADGRGNRTHVKNDSGGAVAQGNQISYHGGRVLQNTVNVYFIWYGNWGKELASATTILTNWANSIGGSPYEAVNSTYGDTTGNVSGNVAYGGSYTDTGSLGTSLTDSSIATLVSNALNAHAFPVDSNGVYFVLTAPNVAETSGFLTKYCGWHTYGTYNGSYIQYAFVGDAATSLGSCAGQTASSPNGDPEADAMVSVMSHELEEAASDPQLNAWYDSAGNEDADKCAWNFGATYTTSNGSLANMNLKGHDYLIQQNWLNANGGYCALAWTATADFSLSVSPTSQSVTAGGTTGAYAVTETPLNGYSGAVTYSVSTALPTGAAALVSGSNITISTTTATPAGSYPFTITGTDGSLTRTTTATLVVNGLPQPTFSISVTPLTGTTVHRPGSASYTVTVTPQAGFTGSVALSASPAKTGMSYGFSPNSLSNGTSTMTVSAGTNAKKGNVNITVKGTSGSLSKSVTTSMQVQ